MASMCLKKKKKKKNVITFISFHLLTLSSSQISQIFFLVVNGKKIYLCHYGENVWLKPLWPLSFFFYLFYLCSPVIDQIDFGLIYIFFAVCFIIEQQKKNMINICLSRYEFNSQIYGTYTHTQTQDKRMLVESKLMNKKKPCMFAQ